MTCKDCGYPFDKLMDDGRCASCYGATNRAQSVRCYLCHNSLDLVMLAHRVDGYLVGWLFVCRDDFENIRGKNLKIDLVP